MLIKVKKLVKVDGNPAPKEEISKDKIQEKSEDENLENKENIKPEKK